MAPEGSGRAAGADEERRIAVPAVSAAGIAISSGGEANAEALPFSHAASRELETRVGQYQDELVSESRRIARRHQADVISTAYVRQARDHLGAGTRRRTAALAGSLGWAMVGATLPTLLNLGSGTPAAPAQLLWSNLVGMVGAILITVQFLRD